MTKVKKNKKINHFNLVTIKPITDNQKQVFSSWKKRTKSIFVWARWNW